MELPNKVNLKFPYLRARERDVQDDASFFSTVAKEPDSMASLTKDVEWDKYSLILRGQRIFLQYVIL